jgi:hypothetical protein
MRAGRCRRRRQRTQRRHDAGGWPSGIRRAGRWDVFRGGGQGACRWHFIGIFLGGAGNDRALSSTVSLPGLAVVWKCWPVDSTQPSTAITPAGRPPTRSAHAMTDFAEVVRRHTWNDAACRCARRRRQRTMTRECCRRCSRGSGTPARTWLPGLTRRSARAVKSAPRSAAGGRTGSRSQRPGEAPRRPPRCSRCRRR